MSSVYRLADVGEAARPVQTNQHIGKVAVLCQAPREGLGVHRPRSAGEDRRRRAQPAARAVMSGTRTGILGTGSYLPAQEITNKEIAARAGTTEEWIESRTQILGRRFAAPDEATSDLAVRAARSALEQAGLSAGQIDCLIVSTSTPDSPQPPTAYHVQRGLNAYGAACFDINVVCSGFVYGLALARSLVAQRPGSHALVIGADVYSRSLDFSDRRTAVLLGDGAGAAVSGRSNRPSASSTSSWAHAARWWSPGPSRSTRAGSVSPRR